MGATASYHMIGGCCPLFLSSLPILQADLTRMRKLGWRLSPFGLNIVDADFPQYPNLLVYGICKQN